MNPDTALTIKIVITLALAAAGIGYILYTPPTSQISGYQKQPLNRPSSSQRIEHPAATSSNSDEGDSVSLTGKKGRYEETRIGKSP